MLKAAYPYYLANEAVYANTDLPVTDKYTGEIATRVALADAAVIDSAIAAAVQAQMIGNPLFASLVFLSLGHQQGANSLTARQA